MVKVKEENVEMESYSFDDASSKWRANKIKKKGCSTTYYYPCKKAGCNQERAKNKNLNGPILSNFCKKHKKQKKRI